MSDHRRWAPRLHRRPPAARLALLVALACVVAACNTEHTVTDAGAPMGPSDGTDASAVDPAGTTAMPPEALDGGTPTAAGDGRLPGSTEGCPEDMVIVAGEYCPEVDQKCLEHHEEYKKDEKRKKKKPATKSADDDGGESDDKDEGGEDGPSSTVSERCLRYAEPSVCLSKKRRSLRFCMDRYEWPNKKGEMPLFLISWYSARKKCEAIGKRLCTENEFNFACEGEQMLPYTYGFVRDPAKCNIDKRYRIREKKLYPYDRCMNHPKCKTQLDALDQRAPVGSMPECVSPFGAYDLNGNVNEWVMRPSKKFPWRSGLKGGWWGPVRSRCRPTVGFHKEDDYGYEAGFRCCKDAEPRPAPAP
jgi:hypothetical protein